MWSIFGAWIAMGLAYRISLKMDAVVQRAFGVKTISIPITEIKKITQETSILARQKKNIWVDRPFRRLVIVPTDDPDTYIDVSLKHFNEDDIRELMRKIREMRPDLSYPKNWI